MGDTGNFGILLGDTLGCIDQKNDDICALYGRYCTDDAVPLSSSLILFFFRRPAVSMKIYSFPLCMIVVSIASRVVPAMSDTMTRFEPSSLLTRRIFRRSVFQQWRCAESRSPPRFPSPVQSILSPHRAYRRCRAFRMRKWRAALRCRGYRIHKHPSSDGRSCRLC